jgi:pyruvate carboxylase
MLAGGLGQPPGGWPKKLQRVVLGDRKPLKGRPGANLPPVDLAREREALHTRLKREVTDGDLYAHLMYPDVFAEYAKFERTYGNVSVVPSTAFFYGLRLGEEITVAIEEGKTLFIKLTGVSEPDKDGYRTLTFELNGRPRETRILDTSVQVQTKARAKADPADAGQIGAPIPGLVTMLSVSVGSKVAKGDKLLTLEAMKMQTTVYATTDGIVAEALAAAGDSVEAKDLLLRIRPAG